MAIDQNVVFDSRYRYENVSIKGSRAFSVTGAFTSTTVTVAHNLGYIPYTKAWYTYVSGKYYEVFTGPESYALDGNNAQVDDFYADTANLYFTVTLDGFGGTVTGTLYYRIYAEPQV